MLFLGIDPEDYITIDFSSHTTVSRYYILPRWYVAAPGEDPWIVQNTDADPSTYVSELASEAQQKRSNIDSTGPFTLEKRFEEYVLTFFRPVWVLRGQLFELEPPSISLPWDQG